MNTWLGKVRNFIKGTIEELGKCTWPTREQLFQSTILVLVAVIALSAFVAVIDFGSQRIIKMLIGL